MRIGFTKSPTQQTAVHLTKFSLPLKKIRTRYTEYALLPCYVCMYHLRDRSPVSGRVQPVSILCHGLSSVVRQMSLGFVFYGTKPKKGTARLLLVAVKTRHFLSRVVLFSSFSPDSRDLVYPPVYLIFHHLFYLALSCCERKTPETYMVLYASPKAQNFPRPSRLLPYSFMYAIMQAVKNTQKTAIIIRVGAHVVSATYGGSSRPTKKKQKNTGSYLGLRLVLYLPRHQ